MRDRLEPHAARLAARNHTAIDVAAFERILDDLRAGAGEAYPELRIAIAAASGNSALAGTVAGLTELEPPPAKVPNRLVKDMTRVVDRLVAGDAAGARQAMRRHLRRLGAVTAQPPPAAPWMRRTVSMVSASSACLSVR